MLPKYIWGDEEAYPQPLPEGKGVNKGMRREAMGAIGYRL